MYKYAMFPTAIDDLAYCNSQGTCDVMCDVLKSSENYCNRSPN